MLGNDVHLRATFEPVFSRVAICLDVDFGDRVHARDAAVIAAGIAVTAVHAVRVDRVPAAPCAVTRIDSVTLPTWSASLPSARRADDKTTFPFCSIARNPGASTRT